MKTLDQLKEEFKVHERNFLYRKGQKELLEKQIVDIKQQTTSLTEYVDTFVKTSMLLQKVSEKLRNKIVDVLEHNVTVFIQDAMDRDDLTFKVLFEAKANR